MNRMIEILRTLVPVLAMLAMGVLCRSRRVLSREGIDALKKVVVNITLPAVLFGAFATTTYTVQDIFIPLLMFAVCCSAWVLSLAAKGFSVWSPDSFPS